MPEEWAYQSGMWIGRLIKSSMQENVTNGGYASEKDLDRYMQAWRDWAADEHNW
jgi:hypothetical protein